MKFLKHYDLRGKHAPFSASSYHWINYDISKLKAVYKKMLAKERGTLLHNFACSCIRLRQKLPRSKISLNSYVNDAIGYRMTPEQPLYYSENFFGTTDAISFDGKLLRIHDLKTGEVPANMAQLRVYAALFCLEYVMNPNDIQMELRIYQNGEVTIENPDPNDISEIMKKIKEFDEAIKELKQETDEYD